MGYWKAKIEDLDMEGEAEEIQKFVEEWGYPASYYREVIGMPEERMGMYLSCLWQHDNNPAFFDNANEDLGYHNLKASDL